MTFDKTFCASPNCKNDCGRKMTEEQEIDAKMLGDAFYLISYAYFCGEQEELPDEFKNAYHKNAWKFYEP